MKKSLIIALALVFTLGIAGSAMAASFSDVPRNHWAYDAINKLSDAGIMGGMGNNMFVGGNTLTRYEIAAITARAVANYEKADAALKSQIDRLAAEFSKELKDMGVRVGRLEKSLDNVTITGEIRYANYAYGKNMQINGNPTPGGGKEVAGNNQDLLRTRLWVKGQVNDKWAYTGMVEHIGVDFRRNANGMNGALSGSPDTTFGLRRAWVDGSIGTAKVMAGEGSFRSGFSGIIHDNDASGLLLGYAYNPKLNLRLGALRTRTGSSVYQGLSDRVQSIVGDATYSFNKSIDVYLGVWYVQNNNSATTVAAVMPDTKKNGIVDLQVRYKFTKDFNIFAEFINGNDDYNESGKTGYAFGLNYGTLSRSKQGSYNARLVYVDVAGSNTLDSTFEIRAALGPTSTTSTGFGVNYRTWDGYKLLNVGASYMLARNMEFAIDYFDASSQGTGKGALKKDLEKSLLWTRVLFYF